MLVNADWMSGKVACRQPGVDPEWFYPDRGAAGWEAAERAKAVCAACPQIDPCLEYALATYEYHGIWAATTPKERQLIRRRRRRT